MYMLHIMKSAEKLVAVITFYNLKVIMKYLWKLKVINGAYRKLGGKYYQRMMAGAVQTYFC